MSIALQASVIANALFVLALVIVVRWYSGYVQAASVRASRERQEAERIREQSSELYIAHCAFAGAVSVSLTEIREDINRNYAHLHDGHVLDRIAYRLYRDVETRRGPVMEIHIEDDIVQRVKDLGGGVTDNNTMTLGQMLEFGWKMHAAAREHAEHLRPIVSEPCGRDGQHASWLSKMFAIYDRMCDRNKDLAIRRLSDAIREWEYSSSPILSGHVEDIH